MKEIFGDKAKSAPKKTEEKAAESATRKPAKVTPKIVAEEIAEPIRQSVPETRSEEVSKKSKIMKMTLIAVVALVIVALGGSAYYFYHQYKKTATAEGMDIAGKVGQLMELPNEPATLATVTDKEKLKDQPFFAHSENGDKALIYTQAKKAILYRPSTNKIIEVMYLSISQNAEPSASASSNSAQNNTAPTPEVAATPEQTQSTSADSAPQALVATEPVKVAVYNGTSTKGMAATVAEKLSSMDGVTIAEKTNATGTYATTTVVNLTGKDELAQKIADAVGGQVITDLPRGEKTPTADILVIAGSDFKK